MMTIKKNILTTIEKYCKSEIPQTCIESNYTCVDNQGFCLEKKYMGCPLGTHCSNGGCVTTGKEDNVATSCYGKEKSETDCDNLQDCVWINDPTHAKKGFCCVSGICDLSNDQSIAQDTNLSNDCKHMVCYGPGCCRKYNVCSLLNQNTTTPKHTNGFCKWNPNINGGICELVNTMDLNSNN